MLKSRARPQPVVLHPPVPIDRPASPLDGVEALPPDPILGLTERFRRDPRPGAINLASGVYQDPRGRTPTMDAVRQAERLVWDADGSKAYLPIAGRREFGAAVRTLLFGADQGRGIDRRACTAHCAGGTGALRIAAELLVRLNPHATVWVSDPTWPNHPGVFASAARTVERYPYVAGPEADLNLDALLDAVGRMRRGDVIVLQVCCHNPTGVDPSPAQWRRVLDAVADAGVVPLFDFAYQGFAVTSDADARPLRLAADMGLRFLVASSFSKSMGLYNQRTGALTAVASTPRDAEAIGSQIDACIRTLWSNPPAHGADTALRVLTTPELRQAWLAQLDEFRRRIADMRCAFADAMRHADPSRDYRRYARQRGMFSLLPLTPAQVTRLRDEEAVYLVGSGRINFCGLNPDNIERVCAAIGRVIRD